MDAIRDYIVRDRDCPKNMSACLLQLWITLFSVLLKKQVNFSISMASTVGYLTLQYCYFLLFSYFIPHSIKHFLRFHLYAIESSSSHGLFLMCHRILKSFQEFCKTFKALFINSWKLCRFPHNSVIVGTSDCGVYCNFRV